NLTKLELFDFFVVDPPSKKQKTTTTTTHSLPKVTELTIVNFVDPLFFNGFVKHRQFNANNYLQMIFQRFPGLTSLTIVGRTYVQTYGAALEEALKEAAKGTQITECKVILSEFPGKFRRTVYMRKKVTDSYLDRLEKYQIAKCS